MMNLFKKWLGLETVHYKTLRNEGAQIIDVRTPAEFRGGHLQNSRNIPLQDLQKEQTRLNKSVSYITVCASGMRSASAAAILKENGFTAVNGGGWQTLKNKLK